MNGMKELMNEHINEQSYHRNLNELINGMKELMHERLTEQSYHRKLNESMKSITEPVTITESCTNTSTIRMNE